MKNKLLALFIALFLVIPCSLNATDSKFRIWTFYALTGVTSKSLDKIATEGTGTIAQNGDYAIGTDANGYSYFYYYSAASTASEDSPSVIVPDDDTNSTGRWLLSPRMYVSSLYSAVDDGEHYADISNSGAYTFTDSDGLLSARRDRDMVFYNDGTTTVIPLETIRQVTLSSSQTLDTKYCYGTTVYISAACTITLPAVEAGMRLRVVATTSSTVIVDSNVTNRFVLYNTTLDLGDSIDSPGAYRWVEIEYLSSGYWLVRYGDGTWTDGGAS